MNTRPASVRSRIRAVALCACAVFPGPWIAGAQAWSHPPIRVAPQGVEYMCGGADREESQFLRMVSPRWAATFEFAVSRGPRGAFPVPVQVTVRDSYNGYLAMEIRATGPLTLTRLEPGTYDVEAMAGGISVTQRLTVVRGAAATALFVFPSNVDFAALSQTARTMAALGE